MLDAFDTLAEDLARLGLDRVAAPYSSDGHVEGMGGGAGEGNVEPGASGGSIPGPASGSAE